jgi:hydroxymethylglutaryl-CoA lyase
VVACPYEGNIAPEKVAQVSKALYDFGCYEISLGDTIGAGTPNQFCTLIDVVSKVVPIENLAVHCHDTYGQAIGNILASLEKGIRVIDSSCAGLGGCPYAAGASGNVATEDVLYLLNGFGMETGVDISKVVDAGAWISKKLNRPNMSKAGSALASKKLRSLL